MSDTQPSSPSDSPDHLKNVLGLFTDARNARRIGESLVWVNTAACLDSAAERLQVNGAVNQALLQIVADAVADSESLVLRCGNVTTTHGDWLSFGQEAVDLLVARLDNAAFALVLQGRFNVLFESLDRHFDRSQEYSLTTVKEAQLLLDATRTMRQEIKAFAVANDVQILARDDFHKRAQLLQICATSPAYLIGSFPFRFLSSWDRALFFVEAAQSLLAEMQNTADFVPAQASDLASRLQSALAASQKLTSSKSKLAKRSYNAVSLLASQFSS